MPKILFLHCCHFFTEVRSSRLAGMFVFKALKRESLLSEAGIRTTSQRIFFEISLMGFIQAISKHYRPTFIFKAGRFPSARASVLRRVPSTFVMPLRTLLTLLPFLAFSRGLFSLLFSKEGKRGYKDSNVRKRGSLFYSLGGLWASLLSYPILLLYALHPRRERGKMFAYKAPRSSPIQRQHFCRDPILLRTRKLMVWSGHPPSWLPSTSH